MDRFQRFDGADQHHHALAAQQHQIRVDVVAAGNGVEDKVVGIGRSEHCLLIV
ncbi:hypothetical protein D3C84_1236870 [compost metagenome]